MKGGTSGAGSYDNLATFKADVINQFVRENGVCDVIEFGCGDGNQLELAGYKSYVGFDVSNKVIEICRERFRHDTSKSFKLIDAYTNETADLAMSLDVIYHLVEDDVFDAYMHRLFRSAKRFVIIYSSNDEALNEEHHARHVRHRKFTDWIANNESEWMLAKHLPNKYPFDKFNQQNTSFADFYFFSKKS